MISKRGTLLTVHRWSSDPERGVDLRLGPLEDCLLLFLVLEPPPPAHPAYPAGSLFAQPADAPLPQLGDSFDCLVFRLPRPIVRRISGKLGLPYVERFSCTSEHPSPDPIVHALGRSLLPSLNQPDLAGDGFTEHVVSAIVVHLIESYAKAPTSTVKGGLAATQLERATELLRDFHTKLQIEDIAQACGLSASHFSRAFQRSAGLSPHRWQMNARVERAKELLRGRAYTLSEVAAACGFADQSHFSRVFRAIVGSSPKTFRAAFWRTDARQSQRPHAASD